MKNPVSEKTGGGPTGEDPVVEIVARLRAISGQTGFMDVVERIRRLGCGQTMQRLLHRVPEENTLVRCFAAQAFGKARCRAAVPLLVCWLLHDQCRRVGTWAALALGEIGGDDAVAGLMERVKIDENRQARLVIRECHADSARMTARQAEWVHFDPLLEEARLAAVQVLGEMGAETAQALLEHVAADPAEENVTRKEAAAALARISGGGASRGE